MRRLTKSERLKIAFKEIDNTCEILKISFSPSDPLISIGGVGLAGESNIQFTNDFNVIEEFNCEEETFEFYQFKTIQNTFKALSLSTKVAMRINRQGGLALQFLVPLNHTNSTFVEFFILPLSEEAVETIMNK
jgi:cell cycle checkpoint protein